MDLAEGREPFPIVPLEEEVNALVGVYAEKLAHDLDGQDFGVVKLRVGTALTDAAPLKPVIHEAEDGHDEGAKIHKRRPPLRRSVLSLPSVGRASLSLKPSTQRHLHTGLATPRGRWYLAAMLRSGRN